MSMETPLPLVALNSIPETTLDFQPKRFEDYLGQSELKAKLELYTKAALARQEPLDHLLLFGPPGLGKTTLATIMASVLDVDIKICNGGAIERTGDMVALLTSLQTRDILFVDEIHRMPKPVEEILYSAMEQFRVDVIIGQGAGAKSVNLPICPFTLIGATTKSGMISAPLRTRFGITERLDFYKPEDLQKIIEQNAQFLNLQLLPDAALTIAKAARGTPRIAKKMLRRVRDFAQVQEKPIIDLEVVLQALQFFGIDIHGLTAIDHKLISIMLTKFNGGPVGLETLAAMSGEDAQTIEEVYEPYLMREGYIEKTSRGRQIPVVTLQKLRDKNSNQLSIL